MCWFAALRSSSSALVSLASSFNPIAAIAMPLRGMPLCGIAYLILGEVPTAPQYIGGSIILIGIILSLVGNLRTTTTMTPKMPMNAARYMSDMNGFRGI